MFNTHTDNGVCDGGGCGCGGADGGAWRPWPETTTMDEDM